MFLTKKVSFMDFFRVLFSSPTVHTEVLHYFHTLQLLCFCLPRRAFFSSLPSITWISLGDCYQALCQHLIRAKSSVFAEEFCYFGFLRGNNIRCRCRLFALGSRRKPDRLLIFHR
jgi:hypothetical protein